MISPESIQLREAVDRAIFSAPVTDLHTHLFAPEFGKMNLWGIDELLTYHYLIAESLRADPTVSPEQYFALPKAQQADFVWRTLFVDRAPLSEATSGVLTVLKAFGLDPESSDLKRAREFFADQEPKAHLDRVLALAGVDALVMTNDPTDPQECELWDAGVEPDPRFFTALRVDRMTDADEATLQKWVDRMKPKYMAISLAEVSSLPEPFLAVCRKNNLPFAIMLGVRRAINPRLGPAGDGVITADLSRLEDLVRQNPDVRFLVTTLARENAHGLCVAARKFPNLLPFGCWWFMNNPSLVEEQTLMRLEMLGPTFVPQHSDARVLEQLIYKWTHSRRSIANALYKRFTDMPVAPSPEQIQSTANALMSAIAQGWVS